MAFFTDEYARVLDWFRKEIWRSLEPFGRFRLDYSVELSIVSSAGDKVYWM